MKILIKNVILEGRRKDIFIEGERIAKIGRNLDFKADEKIDGRGEKAILPGFANCHSHSAMILFRGIADDLSLKDWLEKIWPLEEKLTEDDVYWGTKLASLEMIKSGTTAFNEMYFYPQAQIEAIKEMGQRAVIGLVIVDFSLLGCTKENAKKLYQKFKNRLPSNIRFSIAPHSIYTVSKENLIWAKNFAKKNNLILHLHLSETEKEVKDCLKKYKLRPVEYLDKIGFLDKNCLLAHSVWLSEKEIKILGKRKSNVVFNPCSNLKLTVGEIFPYKKLKEAKVNITLGTDGPASNNSLDIFQEMKFASLLEKHKERNPKILPAPETIEIATKNGAKALKFDFGEIKAGKLADLILIDLNKIYFQPGHNFFSDLVFGASRDCVSDLISNGKLLMRDRKIENEEEIKKEAKKRIKNLKNLIQRRY